MRLKNWAFATVVVAFALPLNAALIVYSASGPDAASISGIVNAFRSDLGTLNANVAGSFGSGRREINWDGVPNTAASPNAFPANFFNVNSPRGVVFSTSGTGFQVSANAGIAPIEFDNINPAYSSSFTTFSAQRLFTAIGSNVTDVNFFIPGSSITSFTNGFGVVFTDVDQPNATGVQAFDPDGNLIGSAVAEPRDNGLSFIGLRFTAGERVARVRLTSGTVALGAGVVDVTGQQDVAVMDDFIYGEPANVPEPATWAMLGGGLAILAFARKRRLN